MRWACPHGYAGASAALALVSRPLGHREEVSLDLGLKGTSGWDVGLITTGAYAKRRHPQYLGQIFSLLGLALLGGSAWAMLAGIVGSVALIYASLVEDRWMAANHPDAHAAWSRDAGFFF